MTTHIRTKSLTVDILIAWQNTINYFLYALEASNNFAL